MSGPKRIQRKRTKGWRMPRGAVYVGRPTEWGNMYTREMWPDAPLWEPREKHGQMLFRRWATEGFRQFAENDRWFPLRIRNELRGKTLCCWCPLDQPCHADVLLKVANP